VFDAYGTLFDYSSAVARCSADLGASCEQVNRVWREKQLQYTWLRTLQGRHADFWQVTGDALDFALAASGIDDRGLRDRLMNAYLTLEVFPEVPPVLQSLKSMGSKTAILSNGTPEMLRAAISNAKIEHLLDAVLSVEEVGVFKTHPNVYQLAVDRLGVGAERIWFISSNAWDAWGASAFGMRVAWCNRYSQNREKLPGAPDCEVRSLAELPFLA
jgi:2-haloacid dehalogenase